MKITFVLPNLFRSGGSLVVAEYATALALRGHSVTILAPSTKAPSVRTVLRSLIRRRRLPQKGPSISNRLGGVKTEFRSQQELSRGVRLRDSDVVVGTWWETMEWVAAVRSDRLKRVHLVQGLEVFDYLPRDRAEAVLRLPIPKIAVSEWLAEQLRTQYGCRDVVVIENGVDLNRFSAPQRIRNRQLTVGFLHTLTPVKNVALAINALSEAKKRIPALRAIAFGAKPANLPSWMEFHLNPAADAISAIYAKCDAWLFTSTSEGFGLPILEALACRTPVIATAAGAAPQLVNESTGIMIDNNIDSAVRAIEAIAGMSDEEWLAKSTAAREMAEFHSWAHSIDRFETELLSLIK